MEREHLALAERHIAEAERRIAKQERMVARLKEAGGDTARAEALLTALREALDTAREHRAALLRSGGDRLGLDGLGFVKH